MTKSSWFLVSCVVVLSGCGSSNGCPNGYEPVMGMCVEVGSRPDPLAPDGGAALSDAGMPDASVEGAEDVGASEAGVVAMEDAGLAMPDAFVVPDAGCPYALLYADADGDGFGDPSRPLGECAEDRAGFAPDATDCNDACASCRPGAAESCNGADDDCDGAIDDGVQLSFFVDADGDGFGTGSVVSACAAPAGHSAMSGDCDDTSGASSPAVSESCDLRDNDCDGNTDEGVTSPFFRDADGDGRGRDDVSMRACSAPAGYVPMPGDCNDASPSIGPGQPEVCNDLDDDCDGSRDEGLSLTTYRVDCDRDGFTPAAGESITACAIPTVAPTTCATGAWQVPTPATDCHDREANAFPGQRMMFSARMSTPPTTGLSYDYNCDGAYEARYTHLVNCANDLDPVGWRGRVPECGEGATLELCGWGDPVYMLQPCR